MQIAFLYADPGGIVDAIIAAKHDTGEGVDDTPRERKRIIAEIARAQADLRPRITDARLAVHRAITTNALALSALAAGDPIGTAWSYDIAGAHPYDGRSRDGLVLVVSGIVSAHDVAWAHTLAVHSGGEAEIRLRRGAPVTLSALKAGPPRGKAKSVRVDLVGQILTA